MSLEDILKKRFGGYDRFDVMRKLLQGQKSLNKSEQMSLLSLMAFRAVETDMPVEAMQGALFDAFNISRIEQLAADDYDDAMRFIMEWKVDAVGGVKDAVA